MAGWHEPPNNDISDNALVLWILAVVIAEVVGLWWLFT